MSYLMVISYYSWLCGQGHFGGAWGYHILHSVLGIESRSSACKASDLTPVVSVSLQP